MNSPARKLLLAAAALTAVAAVISYFAISRSGELVPRDNQPVATTNEPGNATNSSPPAGNNTAPSPATASNSAENTHPADAANTHPSPSPKSSTPIAHTPEGRIDSASLADFTPQPYPNGKPAYDGEPVTAYIAVPSTGAKVALTVNQLGEFPRVQTAVGEKVEVRLAFTRTAPGTPVAMAAQDGGKLHPGKLSAALPVDAERQLAFAFTMSPNPGMHRVSVTTAAGELKTLEFWAGKPLPLARLGQN